ncbi:MAG: hypothetical protein MUF81_01175 [Verrucomicrobia bacterium]|nr:hypothetical protein [Verrucomicrobiota bacterium]
MKIRLRNQTFPPDVAATAQYLTDLAHSWDKHAPELMNWQRELLQT